MRSRSFSSSHEWGSVTPMFLQRIVNGVIWRAGWLIVHAGPLEPILLKIGTRLHARLNAHSAPVTVPNPVSVGDLRLYHDGQSELAYMMSRGLFEPHVTRLFKTLVKPGMTVVDVGANIGYYSLLSARLVGETGSVWAFEPAPLALDLLRKSVEDNGFTRRVHVIPQAIGDAPGSARLYVNVTEHLLSSLYEEASRFQYGQEVDQHECVDVACTTLDNWAAAHDWLQVDLVKIDIEGGEKAVLCGMVELSRRNPRMKLIVEFNVRTLRAAGATVEEFFEALRACGFEKVSIIGERPQVLRMPADIPRLLREVNRRAATIGVDYANLLCEKASP